MARHRVVERASAPLRAAAETVRQAREAVAAFHRFALRAEAFADEVEESFAALKPGLARLAETLDDPTLSELPDTLRQVQDDVLPVLRSLADTHDKVTSMAGSTERIMSFVDDTSRTMANLSGAAFLTRAARKPAAPRPGTSEDKPR
jgi:uncharacterized protein YukE